MTSNTALFRKELFFVYICTVFASINLRVCWICCMSRVMFQGANMITPHHRDSCRPLTTFSIRFFLESPCTLHRFLCSGGVFECSPIHFHKTGLTIGRNSNRNITLLTSLDTQGFTKNWNLSCSVEWRKMWKNPCLPKLNRSWEWRWLKFRNSITSKYCLIISHFILAEYCPSSHEDTVQETIFPMEDLWKFCLIIRVLEQNDLMHSILYWRVSSFLQVHSHQELHGP